MFELGLSGGISHSTMATVQKGAFRADGKLWIEDDVLHFSPFNEDLGYGPYAIELGNIKLVTTGWGKGAGIIPVTPDAIKVITYDNDQYRFILATPKKWVELLSPNKG
ncbi:hypothetical protein [Shewanella gaetbuli]